MGEFKDKYLQLWEKLSKKQKYGIIGGVAAVIVAIVIAGALYGSKPDMVPLFTNMETKDAGEVAAKLKELKVDYEITEDKAGTSIVVPASSVHEARLQLATEGLPKGYKGFEIFDDSKLGVTEFQNKVNYLQALQGELTRTIEQIAAVDKARVHIVMPEDSLYKKNEKPATASIMLRLRPDVQLSKKEIKGIVNLTAHSVQGLATENITIVNETGKILNDPDDDENGENNISQKTITQLEMTRKVQQQIQDDVQMMLDNALGEGHSFVRVNVELDFDQKQTDKQTFTPVVDESGIIRSEQTTNESYAGTSTNPGGPAGTESNIPGYVATESNANAEYSKKETTKNYEISEEKQHTVASPGSIKRVSVAVLVNDTLDQEQQDRIRRAVTSAVGIIEDRGDTVSVEALPFSTELADRRAAEEQAAKDKEMMNYLVIFAIILLIAGIFAYYQYDKRRKERLAKEAEEEAERQRLLAIQKEEEERAAAAAAGEIPEEELTDEERERLNERQTIEDLIRNKPADVAVLIKTWLSED